MKRLWSMVGLAIMLVLSIAAAPQKALAAITCNQAYTSAQGFKGWPYNQYSQYCGSATLTDGQTMANTMFQTQGYANYEMNRFTPTFYIFGTPAEYKTYAAANNLTYVTPAAGAFGVTSFNSQMVPVYSAVFVENQGNTVTGNVPHSTGQQLGAGLNYLLGYITNGGIVPPVNISAGSNTANSQKDNVFQDQLAQDWTTLNALTPCFNTANNSNGLFSGYGDSTSTNSKVNYICTSDASKGPVPNGLGATLTSTYQTAYNSAKNKGVLQAAWPNIYGATAGGALFGEEYSVLYLGNDGSGTSTPISADTYINSNFGCSKYFAKNMGDQGIISVPTQPTGCPSPAKITTTCTKYFFSPFQWPSGNVMDCTGQNDPTPGAIATGLSKLGSLGAASSYTPIRQTFNTAQAYVYVFPTETAYADAFALATVTDFELPSTAAGVTFINNNMHYSILEEAFYKNNQNLYVEAAGHEIGHTLDFISSFISSNTTFATAMQNDWLALDYSSVGSTKANSTVRLPCSANGPLINVPDPSYVIEGQQQPFCTNGVIDKNWKSTDLTSDILRSANVTGLDILYVNPARTVGTNPTITAPKGWLEWVAQAFAVNADGDTGGSGLVVSDLVVANKYFGCTAGTGLNGQATGWLGFLYAGKSVSLPANCTKALPSWWTPIQ